MKKKSKCPCLTALTGENLSLLVALFLFQLFRQLVSSNDLLKINKITQLHNIFVQKKKKGILSVEPPFFLETTEPATLPLNFLSLGTENKKEKKKLVCCTPNDGSSFCFSFTLAGTSLSVRLNLLEARYSDLSYLSFSATPWYILLLF